MKELLQSGQFAARKLLLLLSHACCRTPLSSSSTLKPRNIKATKLTNNNNSLPHGSPPIDLVCRLSYYLREPLAKVVKLLRANKRFLNQVEKTRNCYTTSRVLKAHISNIEIPSLDLFLDLYSHDPRSKILASFHFGEFLYGLNKLVAAQPSYMNSKVLSQTEYTKIFIDNMKRGFGESAPAEDSQLALSTVQPQGLSALLRQQHVALLMFADLPRSYGETVRISFMGRWAWFPKGIAVLALANRVPIIPVICYSFKDKDYVEIGKQIEAVRLKTESKEVAITRITQLLIEFFEFFFKQHQEQWRYLAVMPHYFVEPTQEAPINYSPIN